VFHVVLYQPEIPPNTGNIIRLCANAGTHLHLVEPLGFTLEGAKVRRAGLDYHDLASVSRYPDWKAFRQKNNGIELWGFSTRASRRYDKAPFRSGDGLVFGPETRGLPEELLTELGPSRLLRLPMQTESRSLNLSNTVAVALYEALRQNDFQGLA